MHLKSFKIGEVKTDKKMKREREKIYNYNGNLNVLCLVIDKSVEYNFHELFYYYIENN